MVSADSDRDALLVRLGDEFAVRCRRGERPALQEYVERYPELADDIRELFPALVELEQAKEDRQEVEPTAAAPALRQLGDFRILREVGRGGMGVVYEAEQLSLGRHVALKVFPPRVRDERQRRRFEREAKAAARLHHTNIVPVYGVGEHEGTPYYAMQFIQGLGLDQVIDELCRLKPGKGSTDSPTGPPAKGPRTAHLALSAEEVARSLLSGEYRSTPEARFGAASAEGAAVPSNRVSDTSALSSSSVTLPGQALRLGGARARKATYWQSVANVGVQVAEALSYAHKQGVLHRDIKPSNLLLDSQGTVWVTDFGLAKTTDSEDLTHTGDILGTLRYMPPEAFEGKGDARGDVYSLGLTLYELVAHRPAFDEKDRHKLIKQMTEGEPPPLRKLRRDAPRDLVTIIEKASDRDPARRYPTAGELVADLDRFLDGRPIAARRASEVEKLWMWAKRRPAIAELVVALLLCLIAGTIVSLVFAIRADQFAHDADRRAGEANLARDAAEKARQRAETEEENARQAQGAAEKAKADADDQRNLLRAERDQARRNLYFAEMTLAGIAAEAPAGLGRVNELPAQWGPASPGPDPRGWEWYYLHGQSLQARLTHRGHSRRVFAVAYAPAGKRLATGGDDLTVRLWDTASGQQLACLRGHTNIVRGVAWSTDGKRLASASEDGTARVWDAADGRELRRFAGHRAAVIAVAWRPEETGVATTGYDSRVRVWDPDTGQESISPQLWNGSWGQAVAWSPDGNQLAVGGWNHEARVCDAKTGKVVATLVGHHSGILGVCWAPDGKRVATASWDQTVRIWDPDTGAEKSVLRGAESWLYAVGWSPDGKWLAAGGGNKAVQVWDADTGKPRGVLRGNLSEVRALAWSPDSGSVAATSEEGVTRIWDVRPGSAPNLGGKMDGTAGTGFAWGPDGKMATRNLDGTVRVWEQGSPEPSLTLLGAARRPGNLALPTNRVEFSPDGKQLAAGGEDAVVRIWDAGSGERLATLAAPREGVLTTRWSPDGTRVATSGWGWAVAVWDVRTRERLVFGPGAGSARHFALAWSPDGRRIATASEVGTVCLWDADAGRLLKEFGRQASEAWDLCWSPDGERIATAYWNGTAKVWDADTGAELFTLRGHSGPVWAVAWRPDGKRLATGSNDRTVKIWDAVTGRETLTLRGHIDGVHGVHWHPDGCRLATRDEPGNVLVWDATAGYLAERSAATHAGLNERIRRDPADTSARRVRAEVFARQGDWDAAAAEFAELARRTGSDACWYPAGWWVVAGPGDHPPAFPPAAGGAPARHDRVSWRSAPRTFSTSWQ
jgi:WD40 repeat protein